MGLLSWVVVIATAPENQAAWERLLHAPMHVLAGLLGLSALSLFLNGLGFWITFRRLRVIPLGHMQAANAVASALGYLPFKLSIVARAAIHSRRDGVPLLTIGAWLAANAFVALGVLVPMAVVGLWWGEVDALYFVFSLVSVVVTIGALHLVARAFAGEGGLARLQRMAAWTGLRPLARLMRSSAISRLHAGLDTLAHPPTVATASVVRLCDLLVQAARFVVAASALGLPLSFGKAVLAASTFFLVGVLSPAGALGSREGTTTALARVTSLSGLSPSQFATITLTVSATEIVVFLLAGVWGFWHVRRSLRLTGLSRPPH